MSSSAQYYLPPAGPVSPPGSHAPSPTPDEAFPTFRDAVRSISPSWLRGRILGGILYAIAAQMDGLADAAVAGVKQRFPGLVSYESLALIGRERRIRRGRAETDPVYASRLARWLDDHRRRGGPYAMLAQLFAHYAPDNFAIDLYYRSGRRYRMDTAGTITRDALGRFTHEDWAHWYLLYTWPDVVGSDGIWSDPGTWDDGYVWDFDLTVQYVTDVRLVPHEWNAAHCIGHVILLSPGSELWDFPAGLWSDAGTWLADSTVTVQLSIR